tara:strand:+ start:340 stop:612 length:273 start_codon:yes stop_codon:yes gene_type:complete
MIIYRIATIYNITNNELFTYIKQGIIVVSSPDTTFSMLIVDITPHAAFYNNESFFEMREEVDMEAKRVLEGQEPKNRINKTLNTTDKKAI